MISTYFNFTCKLAIPTLYNQGCWIQVSDTLGRYFQALYAGDMIVLDSVIDSEEIII